MTTADVAIVGAGIVGASVGYHLLALDPSLDVVMLERAEAAGTGATAKATGGVRYQFSSEALVRLSLLSRPVLESFHERFGIDIGLRHHGYLFVTAREQRLAEMCDAVAMQRRLGVPSEVVSPEEAGRLCPCLKSDDLVGGTFCPWDGSVDPYSMLQGFLKGFRSRGGRLMTGAAVTGLTPGPGEGRWVLETPAERVEAAVVVIAAGAHSRALAALLGVELPAMPYRRQVFVLRPPPGIPEGIPLTVDADTGWYAHQDRSGVMLVGGTDKDSRPGMEEVVDWDLFQQVHDAICRRMPVLADAEVLRAYAGIRSLTPDSHPVLGPVPGLPGLYLACGLGGYGIMHSPAVGQLVAEWIIHGQPVSWDARVLGIERFTQAQAPALTEGSAF